MSITGTPAEKAKVREASLRLFATTDLHVHLLPYDYHADRPANHVGLAQTVALLESLRDGAANTMLFDNGDFLQGTPMSDVIAFETGFGPGDLHPVIDAMNRVGYDAGTLGNHEFNYGLPFLEAVLEPAEFPIVSANILTARGKSPDQDTCFVQPWAILERKIEMTDGGDHIPLRVGVIGFAPPQIVSWDRSLLGGRILMRDIVDAARTHVPRLRAAGADLVVALCHSGIAGALHVPGMENAAVPLASVTGIDMIVSGHTHQVFPGPDFAPSAEIDPEAGTLHGVPTVQPGFYGSHLGVVDLGLCHDGTEWKVTGHDARSEPIIEKRIPGTRPRPRVEPDARVVETAEAAHADTLDFLRKPLGHLTGPLNSYFVLAAPNPTIRLLADAQRRFAASLLLGGPHEMRPLISAVAPFKAGGRAGPKSYVDIPPGPLAMRHATELYLFPNTLCVLEVSGAQIHDWLERSAGIFHQIEPDKPGQFLIDNAFACYNFDILDGLTYRFDLTQPSRYSAEGELVAPDARRVVEVGIAGKPVRDDETYLVVSNSYRAGGGGMFRAASEASYICGNALSARDILVDHIRGRKLIRPEVRTTWDFVPMPGTKALFDSGQGARMHMPAHFDYVGKGDDGFERFERAF